MIDLKPTKQLLRQSYDGVTDFMAGDATLDIFPAIRKALRQVYNVLPDEVALPEPPSLPEPTPITKNKKAA